MKRAVLLLLLVVCFGLCLPAFASDTFTLDVNQVDDNFYVYITNANGTQLVTYVGCCIFSPSANLDSDTPLTIDFTSLVTSGTNTLEFLDYNIQGGGYAYNYDVKENGNTIDSASCGTSGVFGCNNNDTTYGLVYDTTFSFEEGPAVPEPGSLMLFGTGLLGAAGFARRRLLAMF